MNNFKQNIVLMITFLKVDFIYKFVSINFLDFYNFFY